MKISRDLAVAMINADFSGLTEEEIGLIKDFPDFTVTDWKEESRDINNTCDLTGFWDHCVEIELKQKRKTMNAKITKNLKQFAQLLDLSYPLVREENNLSCDIEFLLDDGTREIKTNAYDVYIAHGELLFFTEIGTLTIVVDFYGQDKKTWQVFDWSFDNE